MSRVSARRRAPTRGSRRRPRRGWTAALMWCGAAALLLLGVFLAHPLLEGHRLPLGPDGPVYAWWARFVDVEGLDAVRRPGAPALILPLTTLLFAEPLHVVAVLEPVLAMTVGLAGGALMETALGADRVRFAATSLLVGAFAGLLAAGWLANLILTGLFLAALAAFAVAERSWRAVAFAAASLTAAGIAHSLFLAVALAIVAGTVLLLAPQAFRRIRGGERPFEIDAMRLSIGAAAGGAGALLTLGLLAGGPRAPGDTSQDQVFRRLGRRETLTGRYRERLWGDARRVAVPALGAAVAATWLGRLARDDRPRYAVALAASWVAVTVLGAGVLWTTGIAPPGRFLTFAYVLPLVMAVGVAHAAQRGGWVRLVGVMGVAVVAATSLWGWYRQAPFMSERELRSVETVAPVLEDLPPGTPIVVAVDTEEFAAAFHIARFGNVIRAALPPERIGDTHLFVGGAEDVLAGRAGTRSEDPEYRGLADIYIERVRPVLDEAAILVLAPFNPGFADARRLGTTISDDAVLLRAPEGIAARSAEGSAADAGISPGAWAGLAVLASILLALLGGGWAAWGLAGAGPLPTLAAAPAAGLGVVILGALAADRLSLPVAHGGAALAGGLALVGHLLAARYRAVEEPEQAGA